MRNSSSHRFAAALLAFALAAVPAAAGVDRGPTGLAFEALFARVNEAVERGDLPREVGDRARELWVEASKELIRSDAEIEMLKVEARSYRDARQERALEALVRAGAARERLLADRLRALEGLTALGAETPAAAPAPARPAEADAGAANGAREMKLTWEPEDPTESPEVP